MNQSYLIDFVISKHTIFNLFFLSSTRVFVCPTDRMLNLKVDDYTRVAYFEMNNWAKALRKIHFNVVNLCVEYFIEIRYHKLEIMLKDWKIGKSDRILRKKKIGSENRIGSFFKIVPSLMIDHFMFLHFAKWYNILITKRVFPV